MFSLLGRTLGEGSVIPCLPPPPPFFLFFEVEVSSCTSISLFRPTVAYRAEMTVAEYLLLSCMWANFLDRFPHHTLTA